MNKEKMRSRAAAGNHRKIRAAVLFFVITVLMAGCFVFLKAVFSPAASIGIIGGADGPTAIYVTGTHANSGAAVMTGDVCTLILMGVLLVYFIRKRNK